MLIIKNTYFCPCPSPDSMKKHPYILFLLFLLFNCAVKAQVQEPYLSGKDNAEAEPLARGGEVFSDNDKAALEIPGNIPDPDYDAVWYTSPDFSARVMSAPDNRTLFLEIDCPWESVYVISIHGLGGHEISKLGQVCLPPGTEKITLRLKPLRAGYYVLEVRNQSGKRSLLFNTL